MAALDTVANYIADARVLLQDQLVPYRYSDSDLLEAFNQAFYEARRLRPDLFLGVKFVMPNFTAVDTTAVTLDQMYRLYFVYYIVGQMMLRDQEDTEDQRAVAFVTAFRNGLTGALAPNG